MTGGIIIKDDVFFARALKGYKKMHVHHADADVVVFKSWNRYRQQWQWEVEERWMFDYCIKRGMYARKKSDLKM